MPIHGLKADLELAVIFVSAAALSYFLTNSIISNVLFTGLLGALFFLEGLALKTDFLDDLEMRREQYSMGVILTFVITPLIAYIFALAFPEYMTGFIIIGASAAALGSSKVWTNLSKGDGKLTENVASLTLLLSFVFTPVILWISPLNPDWNMFSTNVIAALVPFLLGIGLEKYRPSYVEDFRVHFSKLAFWLIVFLGGVQLHLFYNAQGFIVFGTLLQAALYLTGFTLAFYIAAYSLASLTDFYEKEIVALSLAAMSKNVAVALFVSTLFGAEAVLMVIMYYFVRQVVGVGMTDLHNHGEFKFLTRLGLKES